MAAEVMASEPDVQPMDEDVQMDEAPADEGAPAVVEPDTNGTRRETDPPIADSSRGKEERRTRPKLVMSAENPLSGRTGERRKGRSVFGVLLGTLNKAKIEDKERMAGDAAKRRQSIDARLQARLAREQNIVRKEDESRKDRISAIRKQEDLGVKDSIVKHRATILPDLSNFLITSDEISSTPPDAMMEDTDATVLEVPILPTYKQPAPIYYLPAKLLPSQEAFLAKRRTAASKQMEAESKEWEEERRTGLDDVKSLREQSESKKAEASDLRGPEDGEQNGTPKKTASGVDEEMKSSEAAGGELNGTEAAEDTPIADDVEY